MRIQALGKYPQACPVSDVVQPSSVKTAQSGFDVVNAHGSTAGSISDMQDDSAELSSCPSRVALASRFTQGFSVTSLRQFMGHAAMSVSDRPMQKRASSSNDPAIPSVVWSDPSKSRHHVVLVHALEARTDAPSDLSCLFYRVLCLGTL